MVNFSFANCRATSCRVALTFRCPTLKVGGDLLHRDRLFDEVMKGFQSLEWYLKI